MTSKESITVGDDFPLVCEVCLGKNPYVRMIKLPYGQKLCKIGKVPFQGFRWKAGPNGRYKETIISSVIAKERNICQACLNDLQFGLPVGMRDKLLTNPQMNTTTFHVPDSDVGAIYQYQQLQDAQSRATKPGQELITNDYVNANNVIQANQLINFSSTRRGSERDPHSTAFRNLPKLCTFWLRGSCNRVRRGVCPFRPCCGTFLFPELASTHPDQMATLISDLEKRGADVVQRNLTKEIRDIFQSKLKGNNAEEGIKKRVAGEDSLTEVYLSKMKTMRTELPVPSDRSITTLWIGGVDSDITSQDLTDVFYSFGQIQSIRVVASSRCAFVQYTDRSAAEYAARQLYGVLTVKGRALTLNWAQSEPSYVSEFSSTVSEKSSIKPFAHDSRDIPLPPGITKISELPSHLQRGS